MDKYVDLLMENPLFEGITDRMVILAILSCANAHVVHYVKGMEIIGEQEEVCDIGILLSGEAQASKLNFSGKHFVLEQLSIGSVFGDILSISTKQKSPVTVTAVEPSTVMRIRAGFIMNRCDKRCGAHNLLSQNLLNIIADKFFELHNRINCIVKPTLREKILYCLNNEAKRQEGRIITLPFDREALAGYLNAERSAVSRELSAMKKEGLIDYHKNTFRLL